MATFEIPLSPTPQTFKVSLSQVEYTMTLLYRDAPMGGWVLDIATATGSPIISGIPMVTGADLLAQYSYLGISGSLSVFTDHDLNAVPTFENLGVSSHLVFST